MIISFADRDTEALYLRQPVRWLDSRLHRQALQKLRLLDSVVDLNELKIPPGNRLEALKGDRAGQFSIRINNQWQICFVWTFMGPSELEIVDYH
ncbi:plasmid maintenance system killer [Trueperella bernardiae]|uniref:type II toxin-antitoxin system RelE/ParE family toxin n=1 Tax=Trueperella bernardiae TaxID=59561 RepID=UPI000C7E0CFB|nr:type II toxin-antitoxin system RelE/ParE family toxin [Trueperella bernardiae]PKZ88828.1 plasmid maintenance system killer [Trueperella bernardiae]